MTKQTLTTKGLRPPKRHAAKMHAKVYWPYLPLLILLIGAAFINIWQPLQIHSTATLAYATEMSRTNLLSSTNAQRSAYGKPTLTINAQLNASAQAKANDMVARDYWAHNTPDGQEPWVFFDAQGYIYTKAGENLAYGFDTSDDTIIGWMNSPSHKANLLDEAFDEVGFGFANSANFNGTGEETIIVAHYAKAYVAPAPAPAPEPIIETPPQTAPATTNVETPAPTAESESEQPITITEVDDTVVNQQLNESEPTDLPTNTDTATGQEETKRISKIQQLTGGNAPWSALALSLAAFSLAIIWLIKHFVLVKRFIIEGEHFVAHHPVLDLIVVTVIAIAVYLSQSTGVIL